MKKSSILFLALALVVASCQKEDQQTPTPTQPASESQALRHTSDGDWEIHDPVRMQQIMTETEAVLRSSKGAAAAKTITYRGFRIVSNSGTPADIMALVKGEIDQIYNTDVKRSTISNMATVPKVIISSPGASGGGLFYNSGTKTITMNDYALYRSVKQNAGNVLIHEGTHYLHDVALSSGQSQTNYNNWNSARARQIYAAGQYVLANDAEYLAVNMEAFFTGTNREPYNRGREQSKDPNEANLVRAIF